MQKERNPLRRPKVGDVVVSNRRKRRQVALLRGGYVTYYNGLNSRKCALASWQRWCRDNFARVVKRAA
jgi:hypothetical protein